MRQECDWCGVYPVAYGVWELYGIPGTSEMVCDYCRESYRHYDQCEPLWVADMRGECQG